MQIDGSVGLRWHVAVLVEDIHRLPRARCVSSSLASLTGGPLCVCQAVCMYNLEAGFPSTLNMREIFFPFLHCFRHCGCRREVA